MKNYKNFGTMSGWETVQAETPLNIRDDHLAPKELEDILELLRSLSDGHNISLIQDTLDLLTSHSTDTNNPHNVNIDITTVNILEELLAAYNDRYDPDLSLSEFTELFVRVRRYATTLDIDNNTNPTHTVSLEVANYIVGLHENDPTSHSDILQLWFPGKPINTPPVVSIDPVVGTGDIVTNRYESMDVFDSSGNVATVPRDTVAISYVNGVPTIPVFGTRTNLIRNSVKPPTVSLSGAIDTSVPVPVLPPKLLTDMLVLRENSVGAPVYAELPFVLSTFAGFTNDTYTYSVGYHPMRSTHLELRLHQSVSDFDIVQFNLVSEDAQWIGGSHSSPIYSNYIPRINNLGNGWFILSLTFVIVGPSEYPVSVRLYPCDTPVDPINEFGTTIVAGNHGHIYGCIWQHQLEQLPIASPVIVTGDTQFTIPPDTLTLPFSEYNPTCGTFKMSCMSPNSLLNGSTVSTHPILHVTADSPADKIVLHNIEGDMLRVASYKKDGTGVLQHMISAPYTIMNRCSVTFGYTSGLHTYGFSDQAPSVIDHSDPTPPENIDEFPLLTNINNYHLLGDDLTIRDDAATIYIGYDPGTNTHLNSYLYDLTYYPIFSSRINMTYLLTLT